MKALLPGEMMASAYRIQASHVNPSRVARPANGPKIPAKEMFAHPWPSSLGRSPPMKTICSPR
jgi:hypothetical protein